MMEEVNVLAAINTAHNITVVGIATGGVMCAKQCMVPILNAWGR